MITLCKILCNSLRFVLWNLLLSAIDFHNYYKLNSIMIYINNAFEKSLCFIDVKEIQKESLHVIDDFFAKRHNANKVWYSETQTLIKRNI